MGIAHFILTLGIMGLFALSSQSHAQESSTSFPATINYHADSKILTQSVSPEFTKKVWNLKTGFLARGEGKDDGFGSVIGVESKLELPFTSWLKVEAAPYITYYSSRVQRRFDDDTYEDRIGLSYGYLTFAPTKNLALKTGAVSQFHLNNSQMVSSFRSFPGGLVEYRTHSDIGFSGGARAQLVVPTSSSLNTQRQDREELPTLETQSLFLEYNHPSRYMRSQAGRYAWSQMPARTAYDSTRAGNTPGNDGLDPEARLRYGFEGWFGDVEGGWILDSGLSFGAKFKRFHNNQAPSNLADSQLLSLFGNQRFDQFSLGLESGTFFSEADATVARYSSSGFGNTNREGHFVEGKVDFHPFKFFLVAKYVNAREINNGPSQDNMTNLSLMLESYEFQF